MPPSDAWARVDKPLSAGTAVSRSPRERHKDKMRGSLWLRHPHPAHASLWTRLMNDHMQLLDTAMELFLELASDNLPADEIARFNALYNEQGLMAEVELGDDWEADVGFVANEEEYAEVWIGLVNEAEEFTHLFARLLLSRSDEEKFCHIEWLP